MVFCSSCSREHSESTFNDILKIITTHALSYFVFCFSYHLSQFTIQLYQPLWGSFSNLGDINLNLFLTWNLLFALLKNKLWDGGTHNKHWNKRSPQRWKKSHQITTHWQIFLSKQFNESSVNFIKFTYKDSFNLFIFQNLLI